MYLYDFLYSDSSSSQALTKQQSQSFLRSETPVENSIKGSGKIMLKSFTLFTTSVGHCASPTFQLIFILD